MIAFSIEPTPQSDILVGLGFIALGVLTILWVIDKCRGGDL